MQSFTFTSASRRADSGHSRAVLVTGAAGRIGTSFATHAASRYALALLDKDADDLRKIEDRGRPLAVDMQDLPALKEAMAGIDTVVHLAADPSPEAEWESVVRTNITGTYHVFVAARAAGCRRVVYASSIHAVSGYPTGYQVHTEDPVNPGDLYGVSKGFGEAMARFMASQQGLSTIVIRIGAFQPREAARRADRVEMMNAFVSQRDLNQLICRCIDNEDLQFAIFHGLSSNRFNRLDIDPARELVGYAPEDDFTEENPALSSLDLNERVHPHSERGGQRSGLEPDMNAAPGGS